VRRILLLLRPFTKLQYTGSLVAGDSDTAIDSMDLVEVAPMLLSRTASLQRDTKQDRSQDERT
jgi:hypothetical protein